MLSTADSFVWRLMPMKMIDPVCGMEVSEHESNTCMDYQNKHYCFCSEECKEEFDTDPETYVAESAEGAYEEEEAL